MAWPPKPEEGAFPWNLNPNLEAIEAAIDGLPEDVANPETVIGAAVAAAAEAAAEDAVEVSSATTEAEGLVELATEAEVQAGTDAVRAVTPAGLAALTATTSRAGLAELATEGEVIAGSDSTRIVTPASLMALIDSLPTGDRGYIMGDDGRNYRVVGGPLRNTGDGFFALEDSGHDPVGIGAVSSDGTGITLDFSFSATKVISLIVGCDETLARLGYTAGASVGLSDATIYVGQPIGYHDYVQYNGSAWVSSNGFISSVSMNGTTGLITFNHEDVGDLGGPALGGIIQMRTDGTNRMSQGGVTATTMTATVFPYNSTTSVKTASTDMRFWIYRPGSRRVPPTELVQSNANLWVLGVLEV